MDDKKVHFGRFIRAERERRGLSRVAFARNLSIIDESGRKKGITEKRLFDIEKMPDSSRVMRRTLGGLATALGMTVEELEAKWKSTPVSAPTPRPAKSEELPSSNARVIVEWLKRMLASGEEEGLVEAIRKALAGQEAQPPAMRSPASKGPSGSWIEIRNGAAHRFEESSESPEQSAPSPPRDQSLKSITHAHRD